MFHGENYTNYGRCSSRGVRRVRPLFRLAAILLQGTFISLNHAVCLLEATNRG